MDQSDFPDIGLPPARAVRGAVLRQKSKDRLHANANSNRSHGNGGGGGGGTSLGYHLNKHNNNSHNNSHSNKKPAPYVYSPNASLNASALNMSHNMNHNSGSNSMNYSDDYSVHSFSTAGTGMPSPLFYDEDNMNLYNNNNNNGSVSAVGGFGLDDLHDVHGGFDADMEAIAQFKRQQRIELQILERERQLAQNHPQNLSSIPPPPPAHRSPAPPRGSSSGGHHHHHHKAPRGGGGGHTFANGRGTNLHHASPPTSNHGSNPNSGAAKRRKLKMAIAAAVVLVLLGVVAGVVAGGGGKSAPPPTPAPVPIVHSAALDDLIDFLVREDMTPASVLANETSPQFLAAHWLADYDTKEVVRMNKGEFPARYALAVLYYATNGIDWRYRINWLSVHHACLWSATWPGLSGRNIKVGVSCQDRTNNVEKIFLPAMDMKGTIPPELKLLDDLIEIDFYKNDLVGTIPSEMLQLRELESLILHNNYLTGTVPSWLVHNHKLTTLDLAMNQLTGPLPTKVLTKLPSLATLNLENNQLTGSLHPLRGMPALQFLTLGGNALTGSMDATLLTSWPKITDLDISDNALTGELPAILFSLSSLIVVDLHGNQLEGHLPSIVDLDAKIEFIALYDNKLTGPIDHRVTSVSVVVVLDVWVVVVALCRQFLTVLHSFFVPSSSQLANLHHLDLSKNEFTGDLPTEIADLYNLKYLFLAFNEKLTPGPIPYEWTQRLTQVKDLSLQNTKRTGTMPTELGYMSSLVLLDVAGNDFTGPIPEELGDLRNLKFLILKQNKLTGTIPKSLSQLTKLDTAILDDNDLTGGASNLCTPKLPALVEFISDCKEVSCSCCSLCCVDNTNCNDKTWFAQQDPVVNYQYSRVFYKFNEQDVIYPVPETEEMKEQYEKFGVPGGVRARQ